MILAAVRGVPETYHNLRIIVDKLRLNSVDCTLAMDLKCIALSLGMQTASARYPCPYGTCRKTGKRGNWVKGEDRTLESLGKNQEDWVKETGGNRDKLKDFFNVEFLPLFSCKGDLPTKILTKIPPPPLHTFRLGPVNHLIKVKSIFEFTE